MGRLRSLWRGVWKRRRDAAVLAAVLGVVGGLGGVGWWSAYSSGYASGSADARTAMAAEAAPSLERAKRDYLAEMMAPTGRGACSVVARVGGKDAVLAKAPCVRVAMGGWYVPPPKEPKR